MLRTEDQEIDKYHCIKSFLFPKILFHEGSEKSTIFNFINAFSFE